MAAKKKKAGDRKVIMGVVYIDGVEQKPEVEKKAKGKADALKGK